MQFYDLFLVLENEKLDIYFILSRIYPDQQEMLYNNYLQGKRLDQNTFRKALVQTIASNEYRISDAERIAEYISRLADVKPIADAIRSYYKTPTPTKTKLPATSKKKKVAGSYSLIDIPS